MNLSNLLSNVLKLGLRLRVEGCNLVENSTRPDPTVNNFNPTRPEPDTLQPDPTRHL